MSYICHYSSVAGLAKNNFQFFMMHHITRGCHKVVSFCYSGAISQTSFYSTSYIVTKHFSSLLPNRNRMSTNPPWTVGQSQATPLSDTWKQFDPSDVDNKFSQYYLMISCCVPRPIALVSTVNNNGIRNCAPFSYFGVVCHDPMLVSVTICMNGRGADRQKKDSLVNIEETSEFVVNIMSEWFVESANHTCGAFPYGTDEIAVSGLNTLPSVKVRSERIRESAVQMECKVHQLIPITNDLGEHTSTVVYGRVVNVHVNDTVLDDSQGQVDINKLKPIGRAGGNTYTTIGNTFDMARPKV